MKPCSTNLDQTIGVPACLDWWADIHIWAIMGVAIILINITVGIAAFITTPRCWAVDGVGAALRAARAICRTRSKWTKRTKAPLTTRLGVAFPCDLLKLAMFTLCSSMLRHLGLVKVSTLHTTTTARIA